MKNWNWDSTDIKFEIVRQWRRQQCSTDWGKQSRTAGYACKSMDQQYSANQTWRKPKGTTKKIGT